MAGSKSARGVKEWPLLILSLAIVGAICLPIWQSMGPEERWSRLLFGPEQIACYCCCTWAALILLTRYLEVCRQRTAFRLSLLPTEEGSRILHEDARLWQRQVEQTIQQKGSTILTNMVRLALGKYAISRSSKEASETVRAQAEIEQSRMVSSMATTHYLAWAIPAIGFLGTVRGLAGMLGVGDDDDTFRQAVTSHLNVAFDCTLIALALSLVVMFLVHSVQREEETLVIDCQEFCVEHLINRMYEPEVAVEEMNRLPHFGEETAYHAAGLTNRTTRIAP